MCCSVRAFGSCLQFHEQQRARMEITDVGGVPKTTSDAVEDLQCEGVDRNKRI